MVNLEELYGHYNKVFIFFYKHDIVSHVGCVLNEISDTKMKSLSPGTSRCVACLLRWFLYIYLFEMLVGCYNLNKKVVKVGQDQIKYLIRVRISRQ